MRCVQNHRDFLPPKYFDEATPLVESRAPGRLDVMGGISDYSGGLCLEWPLEVATTCVAQRSRDGKIQVRSAVAAREGWQEAIVIPTSQLLASQSSLLNTEFFKNADTRWARYVIGAFVILQQSGKLQLEAHDGIRLWIDSDVPVGAGVSSSASLEVAAMSAIARAFEISLNGAELARLCQRVENEVVGAPCGIMDQMTVAIGRQNHLLRLLCQPAIIEGYVALPAGVALFGIDSNVKHSVGGSQYGHARCATWMGRRIMLDLAPAAMRGPDDEYYLANLGSDIWRALRDQVPEQITGQNFINRYGSHGDSTTTIDPTATYAVRLATEHPVYEADRTRRFAALLRAVEENPNARDALLRLAGELMIQSHFSYDHRCGLGAPETDLIVKLAREAGPSRGIYGAKITGGGAGGTVAILADRQQNSDLQSTLQEIFDAYQQASGNRPQLFSGSSDGALVFEN
jgi:galactokinase